MMADYAKLFADSQGSVTSLEERISTLRENLADSAARLQKVEATSLKSEKINARLLELGEELMPFSRDFKQAQKAVEELKATTSLHAAAVDQLSTGLLEAGEDITEMKGGLRGAAQLLPELQERLTGLEGEHRATSQGLRELTSSVTSNITKILDEREDDRTASDGRWAQLDSTLSVVVTEVKICKMAIEPVKDLQQRVAILTDTKCEHAKLAELLEVLEVLQGEVETSTRTLRKLGASQTSFEAVSRQDATELKASVAGAVQKIVDMQQDLDVRFEDRVSKTTFQQVKATLVNMGTQLNELRRDQDDASGGGKRGVGSPLDNHAEARLAQIEDALHSKAARSEASDMSVVLNKVMRKTTSMEEQLQHQTARVDGVDMSLVRLSGAMETEASRANQFESSVGALSRRISEMLTLINLKADEGAIKDVETAVHNFQGKVNAVEVKAAQVEQEVKGKASTTQLQTLASTMASLTTKLSEQGRQISDGFLSSQEIKDNVTLVQRLVAKAASTGDVDRLSDAVALVVKRVEALDQARGFRPPARS